VKRERKRRESHVGAVLEKPGKLCRLKIESKILPVALLMHLSVAEINSCE
jgi:hypothetical protein